MIPKDIRVSARAKMLRKEMTPQEKQLWYGFLKDYPVKVYKQRIIESYIVDFYCASTKLVIEIDGGQHYSQEALEYDQRRTEVIEKYGLKVIRFTNTDINKYFEGVCAKIRKEIEERRGE